MASKGRLNMTSPYLNTPTRTEAEARAARAIRSYAGEDLDKAVLRQENEEKRKAKLRFELACREAVAALEDGGRSQFIITDANGLFTDLLGDWWADVPSGEE
jgi:hypothetical protein